MASSFAAAPLAEAVPEPHEQRVLGVLEFHSESTVGVVDAPETVRAGAALLAAIRTFGSGCERPGDASVIVSADTASIMQYDLTRATRPDAV